MKWSNKNCSKFDPSNLGIIRTLSGAIFLPEKMDGQTIEVMQTIYIPKGCMYGSIYLDLDVCI